MWYLISGAQLDAYLDRGENIFLVDMRDADSYRRAHIQGAVNIPQAEFGRRIAQLPPDRFPVLYCYHGPNSMRAARYLASLGYEAATLYGGIREYRGRYMETNIDNFKGG